MLSPHITEELNEQIKVEYFSAYYYLSMAAWCESENLGGAAKFFKLQASEECGHAMKFFGYICDQGCRVVLKALDAPPKDFHSLADMFELALNHEKFVTKRIYGLMDLATQEKEYATVSFLRQLIDEQVEEEASMDKYVKTLQRVGKDGAALLFIDSQLGQRAAADC